MTTLKRDCRNKVEEILKQHGDMYTPDLADKIVDAIFEMRAFSRFDVSNADPGWAILAGVPVTDEQVDSEKISREALDSFERELHFNPLPWDKDKSWERFRKFVVVEYKKNCHIWNQYNQWRDGGGKYKGALTNPAIYRDPAVFMEASYPAFLAHSAMYPARQETKSVETDDNGIPKSY